MGTRELLEKILDVVTHIERVVTEQRDHVVGAAEACRITGLSRPSLYAKTCSKNGEAPIIPHFKTGKRIYFRESDLIAWMTANPVKDRAAIDRETTAYLNAHPMRVPGARGRRTPPANHKDRAAIDRETAEYLNAHPTQVAGARGRRTPPTNHDDMGDER